ncbi:MAG: cyclopropane-fatty-acyl-phospholipid synthase family protein [Acidobacteriia bacterium]|nr:cyclopropane-fatty-acyl-phospholipid synthase family protein [Terriglobia bacterium]
MGLRASEFEDRSAHKTLRFLQELLRDYHPRDFALELWDTSHWAPEAGQFSRFTWRINHPGGLRPALVAPSQLTLAEAYVYGDFDIEGDITGVFPLADYLLYKQWSAKEKLRLSGMLWGLPSQSPSRALRPASRLRGSLHSRERDRQAVTYHYDVSNDFYALWLGQDMVYSCGYFARPDCDLDSAQRDKLDYICRKLRLQPGERLLDIGCGWGGLILHAAREYGVHALGVTLSQRQLELATERIQEAGLSDRCQVRLLDYRDLDEPGAYDKLVSVGMVEHVGESRLPEYFSRAFRLLRPGGVFLNHGIGRAGNLPKPDQPTFTDVYVFPDSDLAPLGAMLHAAESTGFEVRDVENLREHYALTLSHWLRRLEDHAEEARRLAGEIKYRIWRLYLAGSAHYFQTGRLDVYQTLLVKSNNGRSGLPLTRADWYHSAALESGSSKG